MNIRTERLTLRAPRESDVEPLVRILQQPEVAKWWPDHDDASVRAELIAPHKDASVLIMEKDQRVIGAIQFYENKDEEFRYAGMDLFLDTNACGQGLGPEAIRAVAKHLFEDRGHHRLVIDPAKDNVRARRAYEKVDFRTVGVLRKYQRLGSGWHDDVLMEMIRPEPRTRGEPADVTVRVADDPKPILEMMIEFNRLEHIEFDEATAPLGDLMRDPNLGRVLVFEAEKRIAGYAILSFGFDLEYGGRDAFITELFIVESFRNRGVGRKALDLVFNAARDAGVRTLHLQVRADNTEAIGLYRSAGFETSLRMSMSKNL